MGWGGRAVTVQVSRVGGIDSFSFIVSLCTKYIYERKDVNKRHVSAFTGETRFENNTHPAPGGGRRLPSPRLKRYFPPYRAHIPRHGLPRTSPTPDIVSHDIHTCIYRERYARTDRYSRRQLRREDDHATVRSGCQGRRCGE